MNTDKQLFQLFAACPEWLFDLAGLESPGASELRSFTIKELERRTDGLIVPKNPKQPLTIVEFQFSRDETIYRRIVSEMLAAQEAFDGRAVRGLIVFGGRRCDPKTEPWTQIVQSVVIDEAVESLRKQHPQHPLTAVLQPVVESRTEVLESTAVESFRTIKHSSLSQRRKEVLITVFMDWLAQRLPGKNREEIKAMLFDQLTPLEETQFYKDVVRIGEERGRLEGRDRGRREGHDEGRQEGRREGHDEGRDEGQDEAWNESVLDLLTLKFPETPQTIKKRIPKLSKPQKQQLFKLIVKSESLAEVRQWFNRDTN